MKARTAGTFEGAILDIVQALGVERCAAIVGKSTSLIRKWSDPDNRTLPSLEQASALDLEYAREMRATPPILQVCSRIIRNELEASQDGEHILTALLSLQRAFCELNTLVANEIIYPEKIIGNENDNKQEIFYKIDLVQQRTHSLAAAVKEWRSGAYKDR